MAASWKLFLEGTLGDDVEASIGDVSTGMLWAEINQSDATRITASERSHLARMLKGRSAARVGTCQLGGATAIVVRRDEETVRGPAGPLWSPKLHPQFEACQREAAQQLLLCNRFGDARGASKFAELPRNVIIHHILPYLMGRLKGEKPYIKKYSAVLRAPRALYYAVTSELSITIVKHTTEAFASGGGRENHKLHQMMDYVIEYGY